jgi:hypothetical protein
VNVSGGEPALAGGPPNSAVDAWAPAREAGAAAWISKHAFTNEFIGALEALSTVDISWSGR